MKRRILVSVLLAALLLLPASARAAITIVVHYDYGGGTVLDVATFENDKGKSALIGMKGPFNNAHIAASVAFGCGEWASFTALGKKAEGMQSNAFQFVGTWKETNTTQQALLTVAAGPGVQFTISDQPGTLFFILLPKDFASFNSALATVAAFCNPK